MLGIAPPIKNYCHKKMDEVEIVVSQWKNFRNDPGTFQKISVAVAGCFEAANHYRGTHLLGKLITNLKIPFISDFWDLSFSLSYMKPINVNTVHKPAFIERLIEILRQTKGQVSENEEIFLRKELREGLDLFFNELTDLNQGQLFGFDDSRKFIADYQGFIIEKRGRGYFGDANLVELIKEVPLKRINWAESLATKAFQSIAGMTVLSYFREWDFINTAAWASSIGQVQGFNWVNHLDFNTVFYGVLGVGFSLALVVAAKKICAACKNDPKVGLNDKARAPYEATGALVEAFYFNRSFFTDLGMIKNNPLFAALNLFVTKTVGLICTLEVPAATGWDFPLSQVTFPSTKSAMSTKISNVFAPITQQHYVLKVSEQVNHVAKRVLEFLNDFMNLARDGYDKLYKIIMPGLALVDIGLQRIEWTTAPIFEKCTFTLKQHKDLIYATKIFTVLPKYIVRNQKTGRVTFVTPFYDYEKRQFQIYDGFCQFLLDTGAVADLCKFLRQNEIYRFDELVKIGNYLAERQISLFGYSAYVKDIPGLREINMSVKNLNFVIYAPLKCAKQLWNKDFYEKDSLSNVNKLSFIKMVEFAGNVGKFAICAFGIDGSFGSQLLCFLTGTSGLTYSYRQYQARRRIEERGAAYLL